MFISEGVASAPTVYSELESVAKLIFSFVPTSFFSSISQIETTFVSTSCLIPTIFPPMLAQKQAEKLHGLLL